MQDSYTYRIGWSKHNKHYYGVRYANILSPKEDLWEEYFTSSKYVEKARQKFGEPDIIEVRKVFKNAGSAIAWEETVLSKLKVLKNDTWLNKNISGAIVMDEEVCAKLKGKIAWNKGITGKDSHGYGRHDSNETRAKKSNAKKGVPFSKQHKKNLSLALKGKPSHRKGKTGIYSKETRKLISDAGIGRVPPNKNQKGIYGWFNDGQKEKYMKIIDTEKGWGRGRLCIKLGKLQLKEKTIG